MQSVADLGFLPGGGANSKVEPKKLLFSQFFKKKLYEIERIWTQGGARPWHPP